MKNLFKILLVSLLIIEGINCGYVWISSGCGFTISVGIRRNNNGNLNTYQLRHGEIKQFYFPNDGVGWRVWGRQSGDNGNFASLAEVNFERSGQLWYDISQVDGYNLPIKMVPARNSGGRCESVSCNFNLNNCPNKVYGGGKLVACKNLNRDNGNTEYVKMMKRACPNTYTWSKDDRAGMRDCRPGNPGIGIRFC